MKITMYAIKHVPTGGYLPAPKGRGGRGGSHMEPVVFDENSKELPRLFGRKAAANAGLIHWSKGIYKTDRGYDNGTPWSGGEYYEETYIDPQPHRRKEDMEIVPVVIELPGA